MKIVYGVGLLLFEPTGKLLVLRELESKPYYNKKAGMLSPPLETIEKGETNRQAVQRLIYEEIGGSVEEKPCFFESFLIKLSKEFSVRLHVYRCNTQKEFVAYPNDTDIEYYGWMHPYEILELATQKRRREVEPILLSYLHNHK